MLKGEYIICMSSIDWDFIWQGHQQVMASLAANGNRVLFIDNTGIRPPRLQDLSRLKHRLLNWWRGTKGFRQERDNLYVYSPLVLPFPYSRLARLINRALLLRALRRWMRATGFHNPIIWTFLPTQLVVDLIDWLDPVLVVYYCIADFEQLSRRTEKISKSERMLLDRAGVVFVQGEELRKRCTPHPNIHIFPFGVNMENFVPQIDSAPELRGLKTPIIGYVGGIHRHVDLDLIKHLCVGIGGTVVLVGPVQTDDGQLEGMDNVVFAGQQPHNRIPEFIRGFDVGIIPYLLTDYTRTVYPTKLNEYLAMGIPVVTTDLPEIRRFNAENGEVVAIAQDAEAFVGATREAVEKKSPVDAERRIKVAQQHNWEDRIQEMSVIVARALTERRLSAVRGWDKILLGFYRQARRRITKFAAAGLAVYLLLFYTPLLWVVAEPLRLVDAPRVADAIVVFAGGVGESGKVGQGYQERIERAVELYNTGYAGRMIFSSGDRFAFREVEVMRLLALSLGIPPVAIILEDKAASTFDNVRFVKEILDQHGSRTILLVSSPYHMRRASLVFRKVVPRVEVVYTPVLKSRFYAHRWGATWSQVRAIAHEYVGILYYLWKGWI